VPARQAGAAARHGGASADGGDAVQVDHRMVPAT
jgi:hypothetical protein